MTNPADIIKRLTLLYNVIYRFIEKSSFSRRQTEIFADNLKVKIKINFYFIFLTKAIFSIFPLFLKFTHHFLAVNCRYAVRCNISKPKVIVVHFSDYLRVYIFNLGKNVFVETVASGLETASLGPRKRRQWSSTASLILVRGWSLRQWDIEWRVQSRKRVPWFCLPRPTTHNGWRKQ